MDRGKNENELAEERNDPELAEDLERVRNDHPEWADERGGDDAEGANPDHEYDGQ